MKDKLYKNNHHTMYYVAKKTLVSVSVFLGLGAAVAIPTTLNVLSSEPKGLRAEEVEHVDNSEEEAIETIENNSEN